MPVRLVRDRNWKQLEGFTLADTKKLYSSPHAGLILG